MCTRLIIEGNSVYEIDEECLACSREPEAGAHRGEMPCLDRKSTRLNSSHP